jgi:hypothetical protein
MRFPQKSSIAEISKTIAGPHAALEQILNNHVQDRERKDALRELIRAWIDSGAECP